MRGWPLPLSEKRERNALEKQTAKGRVHNAID